MEANSVQIPGRDARREGLSPRGWVLLCLIGATLFAVTILRLDRFVLAENHRDAPSTARILAAALSAEGAESSTLEQLLRDERFARQLVDHRLLADGEVLLRFGYLFRLRDAPAPQSGRLVVAWPWRAGRSGQRAYQVPLSGPVLRHENATGAWTGLAAEPDLGDGGWELAQPVTPASTGY